MADLLRDRVAVVSGGASGIGRAVVEAMVKEGATVASVDRDAAAAGEIAGATGARAFTCDITDRVACDRTAAEVAAAFGRVDVLVNSAAIIRRAAIDAADARETWDEVLRINLDGSYNMVTAFRASLVAAGGAIVNLASTHAFVAGPQSTAYTVSKSGIHAMTFSLAAELGPHGVRVNAVAPGYTRTPMNVTRPGQPAFDFAERFGPRTPLGRPAEPDDIAQPVLFLASDMARYVTGVTLRVDGGFLCH